MSGGVGRQCKRNVRGGSVGIELSGEWIEGGGVAVCGAGVEEGVVVGFCGLGLLAESGVIGDGVESLGEEPIGVGFDGCAIGAADCAEVEDGDFVFGFREAAVPEVIRGVVLFAPDFLYDVDAIDGRVAAVSEDIADMPCSQIVAHIVIDSIHCVEWLKRPPWFADFVVVSAGIFADDVGAIVIGLPATEHVPDDKVAEDVGDGRHFECVSDDAAGEHSEPGEYEDSGEEFAAIQGSPSFHGGVWGADGETVCILEESVKMSLGNPHSFTHPGRSQRRKPPIPFISKTGTRGKRARNFGEWGSFGSDLRCARGGLRCGVDEGIPDWNTERLKARRWAECMSGSCVTATT